MAKRKADSEAPADGGASAETISKSEAVRRALAAGIDKPAEGVAFIKKEFGLELTSGQFSTVKFQEGKKKGRTPGKRGRKPAATSAPGLVVNGRSAGNPAELARAVKALVMAHGPEAVKGMVDVFAD